MNNTIKAPKNKSSIAVRITVAITAAIAAVALVSVIIIYMLGLNALKHEIRDNLVMLSSNAAADIDADMLMSAAKKADETSVEYLTIQKQLQKIQKASGEKIRYIYTLVPSGGEMVYAVDAAPSDDTENHSVIGSFFDSKKYSAVLDGLKQATAELEPLEDTEFGGLIQTGYAPVKNLEGEVAGVLAIDMDVSIIKAKKREMNSAGAMTAAGALVVAVILGIAISSYITRPLRSITRTIEGLSMGDQDLMADQRRNDEIGELAKALNKMVFDLSLTREKLMSNNTELESKVVSRTLAISEINRDVRKMLDNISIAVFTVNEDMKVGTHYSGNAVDIFGEVFTSGTGLLDVLFPNAEVSGNHAYEKACMESWLIKAFESSISKWEFIETIQPVHETSFILLDDNGLENEKFIRIYFQPVQISTPSDPNEKISRMMVVIHDITGEKQLSSSVEKKDKKYPYDINIIIRKIKADTELFEDFINECREYLYGFEPLLTALRVNREDMELVNDLFRRVHTIKGNAKIFSLILIESKSYEIENVFSAVRKGSIKLTDEIIDEIYGKLDELNNLFDDLSEVYDSVVRDGLLGKSSGSSMARNGMIKVRTAEINSLMETIGKADMLLKTGISKGLLANIDEDKVQELQNLFNESEKKLREIRKVPASKLFSNAPRMIREVSQELGKKVRFVLNGGDTEIDKAIFDKLGDPIMHILRNSLDHGIERPEIRLNRGKPATGMVEASIKIDNSLLSIEIMNDGQELDLERIKAKAVNNEIISPETAISMSDEDAMRLILLPGLSTRDTVDDISGRGVGLDIVRKTVEDELAGSIIIGNNESAGGFRMVLCIPVIE